MSRFTEKYIRNNLQWIKITRDNKQRTFTFARGYVDQFQAHSIETLSFKWIPNWTEAVNKATRTIATYS